MPLDRVVLVGRFGPNAIAAAMKVCVVGLLVVAPFGCQQPRPAGSPETTLRIGFGMGKAARLTGLGTLTRMLYAESLLAFSWDGRLGFRLADTADWSADDPTTYQVHIRPGVKLHNGQPLTPSLVIAVLTNEIARRKEEGSLGGLTHVQAISESVDTDGRRVEGSIDLKLSRRDSLLVSDLATIIVTDPLDLNVGTGPFKLVKRTPALVEAERNSEYFRGRSAIERVRIETFDTQRSAWAALLRGDVDAVQEVHRDSVEFLQKNRAVKAYSAVWPYYISVVFNLRHPVLRNVTVRRALSEAVDREEIVREAMQRRGQVADDPISPTHWTYSATAHAHVRNPAAARLRLDSAHLPVREAPGRLRMASRFRFTCLFWKEDPQYERIALFVQRQLAEVGVDMELEPIDLAALQNRTRLGKFDAFLAPAGAGRSFDLVYRYWHSPSGPVADVQDGGYRNADAILDRLRYERLDDAGIRAVIADLRERFREDAPAVFIAWTETTRAVDASIDVGDPKDPDFFAKLWQWRPASRQSALR